MVTSPPPMERVARTINRITTTHYVVSAKRCAALATNSPSTAMTTPAGTRTLPRAAANGSLYAQLLQEGDGRSKLHCGDRVKPRSDEGEVFWRIWDWMRSIVTTRLTDESEVCNCISETLLLGYVVVCTSSIMSRDSSITGRVEYWCFAAGLSLNETF